MFLVAIEIEANGKELIMLRMTHDWRNAVATARRYYSWARVCIEIGHESVTDKRRCRERLAKEMSAYCLSEDFYEYDPGAMRANLRYFATGIEDNSYIPATSQDNLGGSKKSNRAVSLGSAGRNFASRNTEIDSDGDEIEPNGESNGSRVARVRAREGANARTVRVDFSNERRKKQ